MPSVRPVFHAVLKRHEADCAVAALACLLQRSYEEVLVAAAQILPHVLTKGLYNEEIIKVADLFGVSLEERTYEEIDFQKSTGILGFKVGEQDDEHAVVLSHGLVFEVEDGSVWKVRDYLRKRVAKGKMRDTDLLEVEGD